MKIKFTFLFAALLFLTGCSVTMQKHTVKLVEMDEKKEPSKHFIPQELSIVSLGDSLTQGVGDSKDAGGYIPYLKEQLEMLKDIRTAKIENYGVSGNRTDQLLKRLKKTEVKEAIEQADMVMITIGGNDVMKVFREHFANLELSVFEKAKKGYEKRLQEILHTIRNYNPDVYIVLIGIYNPFEKWFEIDELDHIIWDWNETSENIISQFEQATYIPIIDIFENKEEELLYDDQFHPNDRGYELISNRLFIHVREYLEMNE